MLRRAFAIAAVLLLSGLPLAASANTCATAPCCQAHDAPQPSVAMDHNCCAKAAPPSPVVPARATAVAPVVVIARQVIAAVDAPPPSHVGVRRDDRPPTTARRLASLSILLV